MMVMSDRKIQTNKVEQVDPKPLASKLKSMINAFHSLTVAVFCRVDYLEWHMLMGVKDTV